MNSGLFDLNRRHKKLVIQGIDVAAVLISSVTGLVFFGGWRLLQLPLGNTCFLHLSQIMERFAFRGYTVVSLDMA